MICSIYYYIPHTIWGIITISYIELGIINKLYILLLHILSSVVIAVLLELKKNRIILNSKKKLNKDRLIAFIIFNLFLGLFVGSVTFFVTLPIAFMNDVMNFTKETTHLLIPLQSYVFIGFILIWFSANTLILRLNQFKHVIYLAVSLLLICIIPVINYIIFRF